MPVTSDARLMSDVATAPAVAFKKPVTSLNVNVFDATTFDDEAVTAVIYVVDAYGSVEANPSPRIVVVDVRPIYAVSKTESAVDDACGSATSPVNVGDAVFALLLNVDQSVEVSSPRFDADADGMLNVCVVRDESMLKSVPDEPVANV